MFSTTTKIGILGGGQLGKMLCLAAANWDFKTHILDTEGCPAAAVCTQHFTGDFKNYDDVLRFGRQMDVLTIEIENVNTAALHQLAAEGKIVHPAPNALDLIKDKGLQKEFFEKNGLPTARFQLFENADDLKKAVAAGKLRLPFVQKKRTEGYDGRGVAIIRERKDLETKLLDSACLAEDLVEVKAEIAVIACRNTMDEVRTFPAVEMEFHPEANLVEFLCCPARVSPLVEASAESLAEAAIRAFDLCGLLAVEMFLTVENQLVINEVAPRPHNSGHHTIDSAMTSQFQQHLLGICNLPLGPTEQKLPAVMLNLLGAEGFVGPVFYENIEKCLALGGVNVHLYGKAMTSPFRKMGHVTVVDPDLDVAIRKAKIVRETLRVVSKT